jgi:nucleoside-diphosphate-sugar epimerase
MRVVVTGATGNVGTAVVRSLSSEPEVDSIVGIARRRPEQPEVEIVAADIVRDDLVPLFRGADVVIHLAWLIQPSRRREVTEAVNVTGSGRVFDAVAQAGVPALVYASSVGAYSPGPKDRRVDESWPTDGVRTSFYARDKAAVERLLDRFEAERPAIRVVRLRPGLIFQRAAASEIRRLFAGPFLPGPLVDPRLIPIVPSHPRLRFQAVHAADVAEAYRLATVRGVRGPFNIAAEPVLDGPALGRLLNARPVPVRAGLLRALADVTWRLRLQPSPPGWVDMALGVPLMDTTRARRELGWAPIHDAGSALLELIHGIREGAGEHTPPLEPGGIGPLRAGEVAGGVGREN